MNETRYTYTATDDSTFSGTAAELGGQLADWHGVTDDNPGPWLILGEDGDTAPRECTRDELVEWISEVEERPEDQVHEALVED